MLWNCHLSKGRTQIGNAVRFLRAGQLPEGTRLGGEEGRGSQTSAGGAWRLNVSGGAPDSLVGGTDREQQDPAGHRSHLRPTANHTTRPPWQDLGIFPFSTFSFSWSNWGFASLINRDSTCLFSEYFLTRCRGSVLSKKLLAFHSHYIYTCQRRKQQRKTIIANKDTYEELNWLFI